MRLMAHILDEPGRPLDEAAMRRKVKLDDAAALDRAATVLKFRTKRRRSLLLAALCNVMRTEARRLREEARH